MEAPIGTGGSRIMGPTFICIQSIQYTDVLIYLDIQSLWPALVTISLVDGIQIVENLLTCVGNCKSTDATGFNVWAVGKDGTPLWALSTDNNDQGNNCVFGFLEMDDGSILAVNSQNNDTVSCIFC
jgi:hypothetical protein